MKYPLKYITLCDRHAAARHDAGASAPRDHHAHAAADARGHGGGRASAAARPALHAARLHPAALSPSAHHRRRSSAPSAATARPAPSLAVRELPSKCRRSMLASTSVQAHVFSLAAIFLQVLGFGTDQQLIR